MKRYLELRCCCESNLRIGWLQIPDSIPTDEREKRRYPDNDQRKPGDKQPEHPVSRCIRIGYDCSDCQSHTRRNQEQDGYHENDMPDAMRGDEGGEQQGNDEIADAVT